MNATLSTGSFMVHSTCLLEGCYELRVSEGDWPHEVEWTMNDVYVGEAPFGPAYFTVSMNNATARVAGDIAAAACAPTATPTSAPQPQPSVGLTDAPQSSPSPTGAPQPQPSMGPTDAPAATDFLSGFDGLFQICGNGLTRVFDAVDVTFFSLSNILVAHGYDEENGGAVRLSGGTQQFVAARCVFALCTAAVDGGAIFGMDGVEISLDDVYFVNNTANDGLSTCLCHPWIIFNSL